MNSIKIHVIQTGTVEVDPTIPNRELSRNKLAYTGLFRSRKNRITIPVKCFLIEHPNGKKILVDTGWDSKVRNHPIRAITFPIWITSKPQLPEGEAIDEQLSKLGFTPGEIDYVILTHMDIDHDSGLRLVKDAKKILISPEEYQGLKSRQCRYVKRPYAGIPIETIKYEDTNIGPFGRSWDVFADGTVQVVATPGHSQGSLSVKVSNGSEYVLIVGDTGYNTDSWIKLNLPGPLYSKEDMLTSLKWVATCLYDKHCRAVLCAHDPSSQTGPQIIEI